jgi:hypothetical protein
VLDWGQVKGMAWPQFVIVNAPCKYGWYFFMKGIISAEEWRKKIERTCPNCKEVLKEKESGHFVPPSLGEEGFFLCKVKLNDLQI